MGLELRNGWKAGWLQERGLFPSVCHILFSIFSCAYTQVTPPEAPEGYIRDEELQIL